MSDADLTNGAFYGHFASKEDLVATAITEELGDQRENLLALEPGRAGLEQFVRAYLSVQHRDDPGAGCPSAALLDEVGRCSDPIRQAYTDGLMRIMDDIAVHLTPDDPRSARVTMFGIFAVMVGTLANVTAPSPTNSLPTPFLSRAWRTPSLSLGSGARVPTLKGRSPLPRNRARKPRNPG